MSLPKALMKNYLDEIRNEILSTLTPKDWICTLDITHFSITLRRMYNKCSYRRVALRILNQLKEEGRVERIYDEYFAEYYWRLV